MHPDVYKNERKMNEPNQNDFKSNAMEEWMAEQKKIHDLIHQNLNSLDKSVRQQKNTQIQHWKTISNNFADLTEHNKRHLKFENVVMESLTKLHSKNKDLQRMVSNERLVDQKLIEKIEQINQSNLEITGQLKKSDTVNEDFSVKITEQIDQQKQLAQQISKQETIQNVVLSRLDTQEGLTEKILRQMDNFRSVLYERTHFLAEKIENIYNRTSVHRIKSKTGIRQALIESKLGEKPEEKKKVIK